MKQLELKDLIKFLKDFNHSPLEIEKWEQALREGKELRKVFIEPKGLYFKSNNCYYTV